MVTINKILVVGFFSSSPDIYTYATSFYNTFNKLGYKTEKFDYRSVTCFFFKDFFTNFLLLKKVAQVKPDLIFLIKAENIFPKTLEKIKDQFGTLLVNFYPDNPFVFWNGNSNSNVLNSLPFYDYFLIWSKTLMPILRTAGCKNVYYFPFAFDKDIFVQELKITEEDIKKYSSNLCFIGTWDQEREKWLTELCQKLPTLDFAVWGNLWKEKLPSNSVLSEKLRGGAIYGQEMRKAFACSKIILNFIRSQNMSSHNMRTFESAASKAFVLAQRTEEQAEGLFKEGENIECFGNMKELISKIDFYLKNDKLRSVIAERGFERAQDFTMHVILQKFMNLFQDNF